ncbi:hypothetical protein PYCCODRAFT_1440756 [Trametes coccinea BRFM310]|uniref:Uncharacterized protein n=1 Tax=Trametes coccinea (strain BRFM310) TaxID=1353009 RepID=A0A1Y2I937_TRAC3|nr:hypothetical protein PYCCODRAFT_1440756 [Trametes coccinea BRFM310]
MENLFVGYEWARHRTAERRASVTLWVNTCRDGPCDISGLKPKRHGFSYSSLEFWDLPLLSRRSQDSQGYLALSVEVQKTGSL